MTVNTNFKEIEKLPSGSAARMIIYVSVDLTIEYATFGRFSQAATNAAVADLVDVSDVPVGQR